MAKPKSSAPEPSIWRPARGSRRIRWNNAFSLVEVVISTAVIAFALLTILGVMAASLTTHQNSGSDSVLTLMTESSLQEIRNVGYSSISTSNTYYIYYDALGQITADGSASSFELSSATSASAPATPSTNVLTAGASATATAYPSATTVYQCAIVASPLTLSGASTTSTSMYSLKLIFTWPVGAASPKTQTINASISNPNYN